MIDTEMTDDNCVQYDLDGLLTYSSALDYYSKLQHSPICLFVISSIS